MFDLKGLSKQIGIYDGYLRLLRVRRKDARISEVCLARGVWPDLGRVLHDATVWMTFILYFTPMPLPSGNPIDLRCLATPCVIFFTPEACDIHAR